MAQNSSFRKKPNILITGTPGTGKTTMAAALEEVTELRHINVCGFANEKNLTNGWDDTFDCYYINESLVCRELENFMEEGGNIVDHYGCDFFPDDWFDRVVILQTDNSVLYDRFIKRGYSNQKLASNTERRMFLVLLEAAKENYSEDIVVILRSDSLEDITKNVEILTSWISHWRSPVLYSPKRPMVDVAEVFLWLMAVATILCAFYWSAWRAREAAIEQDKLLKDGSNECNVTEVSRSGVLEINIISAVLFVVVASCFLIRLYKLMSSWFIEVLVVLFSIGVVEGLQTCLVALLSWHILTLGKQRGDLKHLWTRGEPDRPCPHVRLQPE